MSEQMIECNDMNEFLTGVAGLAKNGVRFTAHPVNGRGAWIIEVTGCV
jgi:hypothetical protein